MYFLWSFETLLFSETNSNYVNELRSVTYKDRSPKRLFPYQFPEEISVIVTLHPDISIKYLDPHIIIFEVCTINFQVEWEQLMISFTLPYRALCGGWLLHREKCNILQAHESSLLYAWVLVTNERCANSEAVITVYNFRSEGLGYLQKLGLALATSNGPFCTTSAPRATHCTLDSYTNQPWFSVHAEIYDIKFWQWLLFNSTYYVAIVPPPAHKCNY